MRTLALCLAGVLTGWFAGVALAQSDILLADESVSPRVKVSWPKRDGKVAEFQGERRFQSPAQRSPLGANIECYLALGGTRLDKGLADPRGATVRVGLYKKETGKLFFEDIAEGGEVTITVEHVKMNQPARVSLKTGLMHLKYMQEDLKACGISGDARNLFNTSDPEDPVTKKTVPGSVRAGCLDGKGEGHGRIESKEEADGTVTVTVRFPYPLLRHLQDPYQRTSPGGFFEPNHFHFEVELLPKSVPEPKPEPAKEPAPAKPEDPKKS